MSVRPRHFFESTLDHIFQSHLVFKKGVDYNMVILLPVLHVEQGYVFEHGLVGSELILEVGEN